MKSIKADETVNESGAVTPAEKLRRIRAVFGVTQEGADEIAGVKEGRTYSYERGKAKPARDYLEKLVEAWKDRAPTLTVDWFFDGADSLPPIGNVVVVQGPGSGKSSIVVEVAKHLIDGLPIVGELPMFDELGKWAMGTSVPKVEFPLPEGAVYYRMSDNTNQPLLLKNDLVLVVPSRLLRANSLTLARLDNDIRDIYVGERERDRLGLIPLTDLQPPPSADFVTEGLVVEVKRQLAGGLMVSYECESGLTPEMLTA